MISLEVLDLTIAQFRKRIARTPDLTEEQYKDELIARFKTMCSLCSSLEVGEESLTADMDVDTITDLIFKMQRRIERVLEEQESTRV